MGRLPPLRVSNALPHMRALLPIRMTPAVKRRMAHDAAVLLREAWYLLVAAGYMSDAAELSKLRERLESAPGVVSPPTPGVVKS